MNKGKKITLSNGIEIELRPMTIGTEADIAIVQKEDGGIFKAIGIMVKSALKEAIPDATNEEIENLNKQDLGLVTKVILELNGIVSEEKKLDETLASKNEQN